MKKVKNNISLFHFFISICLGAYTLSSRSIAQPLIPGIFETLEVLIKNNARLTPASENFNYPEAKKKLQKLATNGITFYTDPNFIQTILLHTPQNYLALLNNNPCALADLAWLGLIKNSTGSIKQVPLLYSANQASYEKLWIDRETWAKYLMTYQCPASQEAAYMFSSKNLEHTLKKFSFVPPKSENQCQDQWKDLLTKPTSPYYCYLVQAIQKGKEGLRSLELFSNLSPSEEKSLKQVALQGLKVEEWLGEKNVKYLSHFCANTYNVNNFCKKFFEENFWLKKFQNNAQDSSLLPFCEENGKNIGAAKLGKCLEKLFSNPANCTSSVPQLSSLTPRPYCDEASTALDHSRLDINYRDCPGKLSNEAIINGARLLLHFGFISDFKKSKQTQAPLSFPYSTQNCSSNLSEAFIDFTHQIKLDSFWGVEICLKDLLNKKSYCAPFLYDQNPNSPYAIVNVVTELLIKKKNMDKNYACNFIAESSYDRNLLKYRSGCWVLVNPNCQQLQCSLKVFVDDRELRDIFEVKGAPDFAYQPFDEKSQYYNFENLLTHELHLETNNIHTFSELQNFFSQNNKNMVHGVGCAEELLPNHFEQDSMQYCTPLPFILDGFVAKNSNGANDQYVVLHTAIDEIASARATPWQQIILAVEAYQKYHPQNIWSLHGLSKK